MNKMRTSFRQLTNMNVRQTYGMAQMGDSRLRRNEGLGRTVNVGEKNNTDYFGLNKEVKKSLDQSATSKEFCNKVNEGNAESCKKSELFDTLTTADQEGDGGDTEFAIAHKELFEGVSSSFSGSSKPMYLDPAKLKVVKCNDSGNKHLECMKELISNASSSIALSTLSLPQKGDAYYDEVFVAGIKTATQNLGVNSKLNIRILYGHGYPLGLNSDAKSYLNTLIKDLGDDAKKVNIEILGSGHTTHSNHSKTLVVDGSEVMLGGQNMFPEYNSSPRVHDLSIHYTSAEFSGVIIKYQNDVINDGKFIRFSAFWDGEKINGKGRRYELNKGMVEPDSMLDPFGEHPSCEDSVNNYNNGYFHQMLKSYEDEDKGAKPNSMVVGRYGRKRNTNYEDSERIHMNIINNAQYDIKISQQSILFMHNVKAGKFNLSDEFGFTNYSKDIIKCLKDALNRGVKVDILISPNEWLAPTMMSPVVNTKFNHLIEIFA